MRTRVPPEIFYEWYIDHVLIPFVYDIRTKLGSEFASSPAWNTCDGELLQLNPMASERNIEKFKEANIINGKSPGSTTKLYQACDDLMFKVAKARVRTISDEDVVDDILKKRLEDVFQKHRVKHQIRVPLNSSAPYSSSFMPTSSREKMKMMSAAHLRLGVMGILRVQIALQRNWRPEIIRKSFEHVGMWPLNVRLMLGRCKSKINEEQLAFVMERFPRLVDIYKQRGEASDEDFGRLGFNLIQDEDSKDHLVLNRRRAVIFNNEGYLRREYEKNEKR